MIRILGFLKVRPNNLARLCILVISVFVINTMVVSVAYASPPAQDPRPPINDGNGGNGNGGGPAGGGGGGNGDGAAGVTCGSVTGEVINWGFGNQGNVITELKTGSWQVSAVSTGDGNYSFGGLGLGIARLHLPLAPLQAGNLTPHIQDASVYLTCDFPTIANIALYNDSPIEPPATIEMSAPDRFSFGRDIPIRLTVQNDLSDEITNVIVTDLIPQGIVALDVKAAASPENVRIIDGGDDGQLVVVYLDTLVAGDTANIIITVTPTENAPLNAQITNTATLFYRESAADQASIEFTVGSGGVDVAPAATLRPPQVESSSFEAPEPDAESAPAEAAEPAATAVAESESQEEFVPPDDMPSTGGDEAVPRDLLPTTGDEASLSPHSNDEPDAGLGVIVPLTWLGIFGLVSFVYYRRSSHLKD